MKKGGANAPPITPIKSRKCGFFRVSAVRMWEGGHIQGVVLPAFAIWLYLVLDFSFQLLDLTKLPLIF